MIDTQTKRHKKTKDSCHCADPKPGGTCCDLICFERPNYFCGHLLTDTDLSTEQRYAIEKRKLHNRSLHGWGVVCGLRMTCDDECCGILIDEGYALDDCGNDLIVCEPMRFDVIGKLREKGYLVGDAAYDPCKPPEEQDDCEIRQCFYIAICYKEEPKDFTTPFVAGCRPSLTECEPTRIREGVWFDVLNELPVKLSWMEELECRFKNCIKLFTEGQFAKALNDNLNDIRIAVNDQATADAKWYELFCTLRGLLLLYLAKHPDKYNCMLDYDIRKIPFPEYTNNTSSTAPSSSYDPNDPASRSQTLTGNYGEDVGSAFCRLLELAYQHVVSCILGELIFPCKEPCEPACVVLGTVEVIGDKVVHVCNCPRSYVWSFGSFWEVLIATLLGSLACEEKPHEVKTDTRPEPVDTSTPRTTGTPGTLDTGTTGTVVGRPNRGDDLVKEFERICCSTAKFDCREFVAHLATNQKDAFAGSAASFELFSELKQSLRYALDFTRPEVISPHAFIGMDATVAQQRAKQLKVDLRVVDQPLEQQNFYPLQAIRSTLLGGPDRPIYAYQSAGRIVEAKSEWREEGLLASTEKAQINSQITSLQERLKSLEDEVNKNKELVESYGKFKERLNEELGEETGGKKRTGRRRGLGSKEGEKNG